MTPVSHDVTASIEAALCRDLAAAVAFSQSETARADAAEVAAARLRANAAELRALYQEHRTGRSGSWIDLFDRLIAVLARHAKEET